MIENSKLPNIIGQFLKINHHAYLNHIPTRSKVELDTRMSPVIFRSITRLSRMWASHVLVIVRETAGVSNWSAAGYSRIPSSGIRFAIAVSNKLNPNFSTVFDQRNFLISSPFVV